MKPKVAGITGGIGSGKTLVSSIFASLGVPVFHADEEARKLYDTRPDLMDELVKLFGTEVFTGGKPDKAKLAGLVFGNEEKLKQLNALVHPLVSTVFKEWLVAQTAPYVLREAAILLESGSYSDCDSIILVTAPESERISRVMQKSGMKESEIRMRMARQWPDARKRAFADYEIVNDGKTAVIPQVLHVHEKLLAATGH